MTEQSFTPRTRRLAISAKAYVRGITATQHAFPEGSINLDSKSETIWQAISNSAVDDDLKTAFKAASKDESLSDKLCTYVCFLTS